jgi:hypothetical protein
MVAGLVIWGALSDERTDLWFTIATGSRQRSSSRARVPTMFYSQIRYFHFCRLLRLSGLRWWYSTPPPHGILTDEWTTGPHFILGSNRIEITALNNSSIIMYLFIVTDTCFSEQLFSSGLFRLPCVMSQYFCHFLQQREYLHHLSWHYVVSKVKKGGTSFPYFYLLPRCRDICMYMI